MNKVDSLNWLLWIKKKTARATIRFKQKDKLNQEELKALKSFIDEVEKTDMTLGAQNKL